MLGAQSYCKECHSAMYGQPSPCEKCDAYDKAVLAVISKRTPKAKELVPTPNEAVEKVLITPPIGFGS